MKRQTLVLAAAILFTLWSHAVTEAQIVNPVDAAPNNIRADGPWMIGYDFTVLGSPITINALGVEDVSNAVTAGAGTYGDGTAASTQAGIWNTGGTLLGSVTVPGGSAAVIIDGFRYVQLSSPVTLSAATTYTIGAQKGGGVDWFSDAYPAVNYTAGAGISGLAARYNSGSTFSKPVSDGLLGGRWSGANALQVGSATWTLLSGGNASGSWHTTGNWNTGFFAAFTNNTADFSTLNITADSTITLDGTASAGGVASMTIGNLKFGDTTASNNWTLNAGTGSGIALVVSSGSPTITVDNQTATINLILTGTQGLTKAGGGTLTLNGANTYTGTTTVSSGTLNITNASGYKTNALTVAAGATLGINVTGNATSAGANAVGTWAPFNSVPAAITGSGVVALSGTNFINGAGPGAGYMTTNLSAGGVIDVQSGSWAWGFNRGVAATNLGSLNVVTGAEWRSSDAAFQFDALTGGGTVAPAFSNAVTLTLGVSNTQNNATYGVANNTATFSGTIKSGDTYTGVTTGALSLVKSGTGTQVLSGANTYSGTTNINGGALLVDGTHFVGGAGAPVPGLYTVAGGATLGGIGATEAPVAVLSSGKLAPGNSFGPGDLGTGNLLLSSGSIFEVNLDGVLAGTQYDQVDVTGSVNVTGSLLDVILGFVPYGAFTIIDNDGTDAVVGTFSGLPEGTIFYDANQQWMISYLGGTGNDVVLTALPEPSTLVSGIVGLFGLALYAWRERRRASGLTK